MNDTTPEMQQFQYDLIMRKTVAERFALGLEMADDGRELMIAGIRSENPGIEENQIIIELLKRQLLYDKSLNWIKHVINTSFNEETE